MFRSCPIARLGIIGGGQLARMMIPAATQLGCEVVILDPTPDSPAGQVASAQIVGHFDDADSLRALAERCDLTTFDIETIATEPLLQLAEAGHIIRPAPELLALIQDKLHQKQRLLDAGIATADFIALDEPDAESMLAFGLPLVQKARRGGYDGRGVAVFTDAVIEDRVLPVPSLLERYVDFRCELAVMVARSTLGEIRSYPVVEMVFDDRANVLDLLLAPARIDAGLAARAQQLAEQTVTALDGVGMFGVELFLTRDGQLLVNEVAPRTHNSGHWTIEACRTSQFEQHLRAILGLPLGDVTQHSPAVMLNLLGEADADGDVVIDGLDEALALPGVAVHLYGKQTVRPYRKMGHVTITAAELDIALGIAGQVRAALKIGGSSPATTTAKINELNHGTEPS
ncbi:MAG: 5-(carboxyamino)imidazole ribonucleotide synthase [Gammaproteobacteria bacterium]|nr:5-(carboxyamino)imidazole ribonucleotide synthase [Gammaproteobacteria bacterium]